MKVRDNVKKVWLAVGIISLILLAFDWFGFGLGSLITPILLLNLLVFFLSLPCSFFAIPVLLLSNYYLDLNLTSSEGIYLNTVLLFAIGALQWFLIVRFWSPSEPTMQLLDLPNSETN